MDLASQSPGRKERSKYLPFGPGWHKPCFHCELTPCLAGKALWKGRVHWSSSWKSDFACRSPARALMCEGVQPPTGVWGGLPYENACAHPQGFCNFTFTGMFFCEVSSCCGLFIYKLCSCRPTCWEKQRMARIQRVLPGSKREKLVLRKTLIFCPDKLKVFCNLYLCLGNGFWQWEFKNMGSM